MDHDGPQSHPTAAGPTWVLGPSVSSLIIAGKHPSPVNMLQNRELEKEYKNASGSFPSGGELS